MVKSILIAPPFSYFSHALAIPRLAAYLKDKGHVILQKNIDNEMYDILFSPSEMTKVFSRVKKEIVPKFKNDPKFLQTIHEGLANYFVLSDSWKELNMKANSIKEFIEQALNRERELINAFAEAIKILRKYYATLGQTRSARTIAKLNIASLLISVAYHPTTFDLFNGILTRYSPYSSEDILAGIEDKDSNFLISYYNQYVIPWIVREAPDFIGISILLPRQIIPAFTLLKQIKKNNIKAHINIGGATITQMGRYFTQQNKIWHLFDSLTIGMGEYTLDELIRNLVRKDDLRKVPNLIYKEENEIKISEVRRYVSMNDVKTPDFVDDRPNPIILLESSRGCCYGRCTFCNHTNSQVPEITPGHKFYYDERSIDLVITDLKKIAQRYDPIFVFFTDAYIPTRKLEKIAEGIIKEKLNIKWGSTIKLEKEFTSLDFCRRLARSGFVAAYFGLGSASPRVNRLMAKGFSLDDVPKLFENFKKTKICPNVFTIIGFPTETELEAQQTKDFIVKYKEHLKGEISLSRFMLTMDSPVFENPSKFKIKKIWPMEKEDFPLYFNYTVTEGLSMDEVKEFTKQIYRELNSSLWGESFIYKAIAEKFPD